jgi:hypothetical protein
MAAHKKGDKRENDTISSNKVPLIHLSFAFIYNYPPPPFHTSFITKLYCVQATENEECVGTQIMNAKIRKY